MPNPYFRFKQFLIQQNACAMKVCTDSCLFGAWVADYLQQPKNSRRKILDIGAGTGLLALMLAQTDATAFLHLVEADEKAAKQAGENVKLSPWQDRLQVFPTRIQDYFPKEKYDFLICNPPFYNNDLKGNEKSKNAAHHSTELSFTELIESIKRLLSANGKFAILLPHHRTAEWLLLSETAGFYPEEKVFVKQSDAHSFFRTMLLFSKEKTEVQTSEITIKNGDQYTSEFIGLLKEFYLHL